MEQRDDTVGECDGTVDYYEGTMEQCADTS